MTWFGWSYLIAAVLGSFVVISDIGKYRKPLTAGVVIFQIVLQAALVAGNYFVGMRP